MSQRRAVGAARLGVLMLDTAFARLPGDVGHPATFDFPVHDKVVAGATPARVVTDGAEGLLDSFIAAGRELVAMGVDGLTTTCGFLAVFQHQLAEACGVPVASSSLLQVPLAAALLPPGKRVGVLTIAAESLTPRHLQAVGVPLDTPIVGLPPGAAFRRAYLEGETGIDVAQLTVDMEDAAVRLLRDHPDVGAIVSECANMPTFSAATAERCAVPVYDTLTLIEWFYAGLQPRRFAVSSPVDSRRDRDRIGAGALSTAAD